MSVRLTLATKPLSGLAAYLNGADEDVKRAARATVAKYTRKTWERARELAPVSDAPRKVGDHIHEPGFLRSKIRERFSDDGLVGQVGWLAEDFEAEDEPNYFRFTERGTRFMKARPCVTPARDETYPEFRAALGQDIRGGLQRKRRRVG